MYQTVTHNIEVTVSPRFMPEKSSAEKGLYFWAYTIEIANRGPVTVQLKTRHWRITDGFGRIQEVRGAGVVGEEPVLEPGASYEYTSGVPLPTPSGIMEGTYGMVTTDGKRFDIDIPAFSLDGPEAKRTTEIDGPHPSGIAARPGLGARSAGYGSASRESRCRFGRASRVTPVLHASPR